MTDYDWTIVQMGELIHGMQFRVNQLGKDWGDLLDAWGQGHIELMMELVTYAKLVMPILNSFEPQDFPGVFEYEVTEEFGAWLVDQLLARHVEEMSEGRYVISSFSSLPDTSEAKNWLRIHTEQFFAQGTEFNEIPRATT